MKNTFIVAMFIFWGFVVSVISAGYVVRENRIAQEAMQKTIDEKFASLEATLLKNRGSVTVINKQTTSPTTSTVTGTKTVTTAGPSAQAPVPAPTPSRTTLNMTTVAAHATESDCWIVVSGKVYSVTSYIPMHPGGKRRIVNQCGGDATTAFENAGHSSRAYSLLGGYLVGTLQ